MTYFKKVNHEMKYKLKKHKMLISGITVSLLSCSLFWYGTVNNAYALSVDGEVIAVIKEKEQATIAYEEVVTALKKDVGVDIAVNEALKIEPVRSKTSDINTYDELTQALTGAISYGVEAYEILVNGKSYAIVDSKAAAEAILQEIAKGYLPSSGEVTLKVDQIKNEDETTKKDNNTEKVNEEVSQEVSQEINKEQQILQENSEQQLAQNQSMTQNAPEQSAESQMSTEAAQTEIVQVPEALPQAEVTQKITVDDIQVAEEAATQVKSEGQKIERAIKGLNFNEEVIIRNVYVEAEEILTQKEAKEKLLTNESIVVNYELVEGDNIWDIAAKKGTTVEKILELNPQIQDQEKMQIGDVIQIEVAKPILSISTIETATFKELIPAEVEYVEFSDLYRDETKVYQEGNDGMKELVVEVTKVNGKEVSRKLLSETILSEAKATVIAYGTKDKPVVIQKSSSNNASNDRNNDTNRSNSSQSNNNKTNTNYSSGTFIHPLKGAGTFSSGYGSRWGSFHKGVDYAASAGTPIYASAAGEVIYSGYNSGGYGKLIIIDHHNGYQTYYAHLSSLYVNVGTSVEQGQNIGGVGSTGNSTGNHLHFEVRRDGTPNNPSNFIN